MTSAVVLLANLSGAVSLGAGMAAVSRAWLLAALLFAAGIGLNIAATVVGS
jgi:hypothetical protein